MKKRGILIIVACAIVFSIISMSMKNDAIAANEALDIDTVAPVIDFYEDTIVVAENAKLFRITAYDVYEQCDVEVEYIWPNGTEFGDKGLPKIGRYALTLRATDNSGNRAEKKVTVIVTERDTTAPVISVKSETLNAIVGTKPMLYVIATDDSGLEPTVSYKWSDGALDADGKLTKGIHKYKITATDSEQNQSVKVITVNVTENANWTKPVIDEEVNYNTAGHDAKEVIVKAQYKKNGYQELACVICNQSMGDKETIYAPKTVVVSTLNYNGKYQTSKVVVKDSEGKIIPASNYTVSGNRRKNIGSYTVTVTFKKTSKYYTGRITGKGKIVLTTTKLKKLTSGSKELNIKWMKQSRKVSGYQISYSINKNFKKAKNVVINNNKKTTKTIEGLKENKKYYVRIRTFYKNKNKTYYSSWSKVKNITTKK